MFLASFHVLADFGQTINARQILTIALESLVQDASTDPKYTYVSGFKQPKLTDPAEQTYPF